MSFRENGRPNVLPSGFSFPAQGKQQMGDPLPGAEPGEGRDHLAQLFDMGVRVVPDVAFEAMTIIRVEGRRRAWESGISESRTRS